MVIKTTRGFNMKNDFMLETIRKQCGGELSMECQSKLASDIREGILKKRPKNRVIHQKNKFNHGDDDMNVMKKMGYNIALAEYDNALGIGKEATNG